MQTDRDDIDKQLLLLALEDAYGLGLQSITFTPKGQEAYSYIARAAGGADYFVRLQPADKARELERVYPILVALQRRELSEALAPLVTRSGRSTIAFDGELVAVFPFVEGRTLWQRGATLADLEAAVSIVARLHQAPLASSLPREGFDNPFEHQIRAALDVAATDRERRPLQEEACRLLRAEHGDIVSSLGQFARLGRQARRLAFDWVPTHGDPNRDNFLEDQHGTLHLTDWGELAAGPPERDLWHFSDQLFDVLLRRYLSLRPLESLSVDAFAFYAYRWSMQEIADYTTRLLLRDLGRAEDELAWKELQDYLPIRHAAIAESLEAIRSVINTVLG